MPSYLCPVCKTWLCGNVKDGTFCNHCGYSAIGEKEIERRKKERGKKNED